MLDEDVLKEIGEVLIDPGRIDIKVAIGKGTLRSSKLYGTKF